MNHNISSTAIVNVSEALKQKLVEGGILSEDKIRFNAPDDRPDLTEPYLLVYLYSVSEDPSLRNYENPIRYVTPDGNVSSYVDVDTPPTVVDLHYLFIPYGPDPNFEMIIIGGIKRIFRNQPIIQPKYLPAQMNGTQIRAVSDNPDMDYIYRLWSLFPSTSYKLSLIYTITPVILHSGEVVREVRNTQVNEVYYHREMEDSV